jgi:hypothetical protein
MNILIGAKNTVSEYSKNAKYLWVHIRGLGLALELERETNAGLTDL